MKTKLLLPIVTMAIVGLLGGCCNPGLLANVAVPLDPQETGNWCWAATTQMIAAHFGINVTQCDLANYRFGKNNCCNNQTQGASCPKTNDCNTPGWPEFDHVGLKFQDNTTPLTWAAIQSQIDCSQLPMGYAFGTPGVTGHVMVLTGYVSINGTNYIAVNDPWSPCTGAQRFITYDSYATPGGTATHWDTFYNIAKK